jgi:hypothetical protein
MARACVFCGSSSLTVEHAVPLWIHGYLVGIGKLTHEREGETYSEWQTEQLNITVSRVCDSCNGGWMSRLEGRAKPLLIDPIRNRTQIWTVKEQRTVATWAYKTALMCGLATGQNHVPDTHFTHLRKHLHPPGSVRVWATAHGVEQNTEEFAVAWAQSRGLAFQGSRGTQFNGYAITVSVGHIAFQVFGHEAREHLHVERPAIQGISPDNYDVPLWPTQPGPVRWPRTHGFDFSGLALYAARLG